MALVEKHDVRSVSVRENSLFIELISYKVNPLIVYYITNRPDVALVAEKYGVDRIWIDLETLGKEDRQRNLNTVKSNHTISDIAAIKPLLTRAEMMVRVNPWHNGSKEEIEAVLPFEILIYAESVTAGNRNLQTAWDLLKGGTN